MRENKIAKELEKSIGHLIPVPGLELCVEHDRSGQWDLFIKADYQGLLFDIIVETVSINSIPVFHNKISRLGEKPGRSPGQSTSHN